MSFCKKIGAMLLALALCMSMMTFAFAANEKGVTFSAKLSKDSITKDGNAQEITVTITADKDIVYSGIGFKAAVPTGMELTAISVHGVTLAKGDYNLSVGKLAWQEDELNNVTCPAGEAFITLTYKISADVAAAKHDLGVKELEITESPATVWEDAAIATTALTVNPDPSQHEHVWSDKWTTDGSKHWHTCTVAGCTAKNDEAAHSSTGDNAATCTAAAKCDVCEVSYGTALGHKWTAATCTAPKTCSVCKATEGKALGHDYNTTTWGSDDTNHFHKCNRCDDKTDVAAHTFGDGVVTLLPTIEKDGVKTFTCSVCKATKTEAIPKLANTDANKDQSAANDVINKINAIGKVTTKSGDAIKAAREAYDKLTDAQKELAKDALSVLEAAEKEYARLTAAPDHSGRNYPAKGGSTTTTKDGKTVESGKTFDAGIALYVGLSVLSVTGGALVIGKKKEF